MMEALEKKEHYNELYDYYQILLTQKQQEIFEDYYGNDYSLGEIAESNKISRNAVFDTIRKVEKILDSYEEKLKLAQKNHQLEKYLCELENETSIIGKQIITKIREME